MKNAREQGLEGAFELMLRYVAGMVGRGKLFGPVSKLEWSFHEFSRWRRGGVLVHVEEIHLAPRHFN